MPNNTVSAPPSPTTPTKRTLGQRLAWCTAASSSFAQCSAGRERVRVPIPARASPKRHDKQPRPRPKALPILLRPHISQNTSYVFAIHMHFQRQDPIPCSRGRWGFRQLGCHHENQLRLPSRLGAGSAHAVGASLFSLPTFQNPLPVVLVILSPRNTPLPGSVWLTMTVQQQLHFSPRWSKKALIRRSLTKTAEQPAVVIMMSVICD